MAAEAPGRSFTGIYCGHDLGRIPKEQTLPFSWILTFAYGGGSQLGAILLPLGDISGCVTPQEGRCYWCLIEERPGMLLNILCTKTGLPPQKRMITSTGYSLRNPGIGRSKFKMLEMSFKRYFKQVNLLTNPWNSWLTARGLMYDRQPKIQTWELILEMHTLSHTVEHFIFESCPAESTDFLILSPHPQNCHLTMTLNEADSSLFDVSCNFIGSLSSPEPCRDKTGSHS